MAAPSTVYKDYMTRRRKGGSPNVDIDLYVAKFLQNTTPPSGDDWGDGYFNAADIPPTAADWSAANAKIKAIFKVDGFLCVPKGTTENGFIGYCYSRTSENGLYHKTERFSGVRVPTTTHATAELLNDAGLNRKGVCFVDTIYARWCNYLRFSAYFRSSFYNPTLQHGAIVNSITYNRGTIEPKYPRDESFILLSDGITPGATLGFQTFITNEEGTMSDTTSATALEKIWAATGAGDGVGGGTVYKLTAATDPTTSDKIYNSNAFFMRLTEFKNLATIPVQGQLPTEDCIGYKDDQLHLTPNLIPTGFYYIWNYPGSDTSIPIYGNYQGTSGKVFHADANGQFDYYIARAVSIPTIKVYADVADGSVNIRAALVNASGGTEVPFINNFGVNIVISVGIRWYNDLVTSAVFGSTVTPTSNTLTIFQGESLSNIRQFIIDDPSETPAYVAAYELSKTPAPNGSNYSGAVYLRTLYGY